MICRGSSCSSTKNTTEIAKLKNTCRENKP